MKIKLLSLLLLLIVTTTATMLGQNPIPNPSFENWSKASPDLPENPDNWHTGNRPGNPNVTPSEESAEGSFSARLEVKEVPVVGGLPASLEVYHDDASGFPVTERHAALSGFYKLDTGSDGATVTVEIKMKKGDELIGSAIWNTNYSASTYSNFYLPIIYSSGVTPDRCFITIEIGPNAGSTSAGGIAWVDDFDLTEALEPALLLHSPNGKENWFGGDKQNIIWESQGIVEVKIEYTSDNGSTWLTVADKVSASLGSYEWTIPNTPSETCKVRISDANNASFMDISDANFSIIDPAQAFLFLTTPSGGVIWEAATQESIIWQSVNITNVKIEYTHDGGSSWTEVVASTAADAGSYL
jgi:hypothetical protein